MGVRVTEKRDGITSGGVRYFITSCYLSGKRFAQAVRGHWAIENSLHWVLDVTFDEDHRRFVQCSPTSLLRPSAYRSEHAKGSRSRRNPCSLDHNPPMSAPASKPRIQVNGTTRSTPRHDRHRPSAGVPSPLRPAARSPLLRKCGDSARCPIQGLQSAAPRSPSSLNMDYIRRGSDAILFEHVKPPMPQNGRPERGYILYRSRFRHVDLAFQLLAHRSRHRLEA